MLVGMGQRAGQRDGGACQGPAFLVGPAASLSTLGGSGTFFSALLLPAPRQPAETALHAAQFVRRGGQDLKQQPGGAQSQALGVSPGKGGVL